MAIFGKKRDKQNNDAPLAGKKSGRRTKTGQNVFSAEEYHQSRGIYDRSLKDVHIYEIQPIPPDDADISYEIVLGEFVEMTEGMLTLGVITKSDGLSLFNCQNTLTLSYSKHGESFHANAKIVEAYIASDDTSDDAMPTRYILQAVLCTEPVRHKRKHGRVAINWTVYLKTDEHGQSITGNSGEPPGSITAETVDISEGGFKGNTTRHFERGSIIKCAVEVEKGIVSSGELVCKVVRCCLAGSPDMHEMTAQFIAMDDTVREFITSWVKKAQLAKINSEPLITVSEDEYEARIELLPPQNNGADLTYEQLVSALNDEDIIYGIDNDLLKRLSEKPHYNLEHVVARCTPPKHGLDAVVNCLVDMNPTFTPKLSEDGSADFKDLGIIQKVRKGYLLAEKTPATRGTPGTSVKGKPLEATPGKDEKFPAGKNTVESETGTELLADIDGFISIADRKINVHNTYIVEGDVQYSTGNIDHNGIVIVKGDVRSGFSVIAEGDIVVHGSVESASVKAGGSIVVHGGCVGEASKIEAGGNVAVKFIDGGNVSTMENLTTSYMLGSRVSCGGVVEMVGLGLIRNSHVTARTTINAKTIGGARTAADKTIVEVGNDPALLNLHSEITKELTKLSKDLENLRISIRTLTMKKYKKELPEKQQELLSNYKVLADQLAKKEQDLAEKLERLTSRIDKLGFGEVYVSGIAYEGLKVIIGPCELVIHEKYESLRMFRDDKNIVIESLGKQKAKGLLRRGDFE